MAVLVSAFTPLNKTVDIATLLSFLFFFLAHAFIGVFSFRGEGLFADYTVVLKSALFLWMDWYA
jgi:hypothetical protein